MTDCPDDIDAICGRCASRVGACPIVLGELDRLMVAREDRIQAHRVKIARSAFYTGRAVARGESTPDRAKHHLETMASALDPASPVARLRLVDDETAQRIVSVAFYEGLTHGEH